ncbi:tape measure protein [Erysipelothrix sp. D19-032]
MASTEMFLALNNAVLAGNAPMDMQRSALEQLSQAYAKGKPDMMEWRSAISRNAKDK